MKVSDYITEFLVLEGCDCVFGYPGGAVTHLIDSMYRNPSLQFVETCHEQAAAFAAEGYARIKNAPGVAIATSGPGATNLITGIGSSYFDSIPVLYLTGQVNTYEYKGSLELRQLGFQETDIVSIVRPITKYAVRVTDPLMIRRELEKAAAIAVSGRPGPVLIDLPMDVQRSEILPQTLESYQGNDFKVSGETKISSVGELLKKSRRPVLLAGGGVRLSGGAPEFRTLAEKLKLPVVSSLMGRDVCGGMDRYAGMIGSYGCRCANLAVANSDLVLAVGTRLDTRQTGTNPKSFARGAQLIRVDIDPAEFTRPVKPEELAIRMDAKEFLKELSARADKIRPRWRDWTNQVRKYQEEYPVDAETGPGEPNRLLRRLSEALGPHDMVCLDVGQNQMWAAQSLNLKAGQRLLTSGGMGAMGFALPCAVGACYAGHGGTVVAITGDGGAQMNIQELETIVKYRIPVKIIVFNNRSLGMIRQFQELYFGGRCNATVTDYAAPDFCKIADAYEIKNMCARGEEDWNDIQELLSLPEPVMIEFPLPQTTLVVPKLEVGRPIEDQNPLLDRGDFRKDMLLAPYDEANRYRDRICSAFDRYKRKNPDLPLRRIPIVDSEEKPAGFLRPITADFRQSLPGIESLLAEWRNGTDGLSENPFTATPQGTAVWLDRRVIGKEDRILFLIQTPDGKPAGHIGFATFQYEEKSCEVDAVLRGDPNARSGLMSFALKALLRWGYAELGLEIIRLRVFQDNPHAIHFYLRNGFVIEREESPNEKNIGRLHTVMRDQNEKKPVI